MHQPTISIQNLQALPERGFGARDYYAASLIGFLVGILIIPVLLHLGIYSLTLFVLLPFFLSLVWTLGLWVGGAISNRLPILRQFIKFAVVGTLNTAIDFGTLNILSMVSGVTAGFVVGGINIPGLSLAFVNSYCWNKFWVFRNGENDFSDLPMFLAVTTSGILINSGIVIGLTTYAAPLWGMAAEAWLNAAKVAATGVSMVWIFSGYKFMVFRPTLKTQ